MIGAPCFSINAWVTTSLGCAKNVWQTHSGTGIWKGPQQRYLKKTTSNQRPIPYPKNPDTSRFFVGLMVSIEFHPQNRTIGEIPFWGHIWILRVKSNSCFLRNFGIPLKKRSRSKLKCPRDSQEIKSTSFLRPFFRTWGVNLVMIWVTNDVLIRLSIILYVYLYIWKLVYCTYNTHFHAQ